MHIPADRPIHPEDIIPAERPVRHCPKGRCYLLIAVGLWPVDVRRF